MVGKKYARRAGWRRRFAAAVNLLTLALLACVAAAWADVRPTQAAVIIMYHRFGESSYPTTSIRLEQFEAHLRELTSGGYTVVPLEAIVTALNAGETLPDRTIGISVDDAYLSAYREAAPRLKAAGLPWTLFIATEPVDRGLGDYMTWDQIRELARGGVGIGSQTHSHPHMPTLAAADNAAELQRANERIAAETGAPPTLFAYPYGEAGLAVMDVVRKGGFASAFGQHSGVIGTTTERYYLPRFAMNEDYGDMARFKLAINALPLEVSGVTPADPLLGQNPPAIGFTLVQAPANLDRLACYASHEGRVQVEELGGVRVEIRLATPFPRGRGRINCTAPAADGRWHWYGRQFYVP